MKNSDLMTLVPKGDGVLLISDIGVPVENSMMAADAIHALRSSLDFLMSALARKAGIGDKRVLFPFTQSEEELAKTFEPPAPGKKLLRRTKEFQRLCRHYPQLKTLLIERIKPYPQSDFAKLGLGHALYLISNADNADKHRFAALSVQITRVDEVIIELGNGAGDVSIKGFDLIGSGFRFPAGSKLKSQPKFSAGMFFPEGSMLANKPVAGTLIQLIEFVRQTITIFEQIFDT